MDQISNLKVAVQQRQDNILPEVVIRSDLEQIWIDALGELAGMMRFRHGLSSIVQIRNEVGFVNGSGELVVTAGVNGETLQIAFPVGTWRWKCSPTPL